MSLNGHLWPIMFVVVAIALTGCVGGPITPDTRTLTISVEGEGTVTPGVGTHRYKQPLPVSLTAIPSSGWLFSHWEGDVAFRYAAATTFVVERQEKVMAVFTPATKPISAVPPGGLITRRSDGSLVHPRPNNEEDIQFIMIHAMSDAAANPTDPFRMERIRHIFDTYKVEAHYVIDRYGTIYQFVQDHLVARHAGSGSWNSDPRLTNMNRYSLGIELLGLGVQSEMEPVIGAEANAQVKERDRGYTDAQYRALQHLVRYLRYRYDIPGQNILGHAEYDPGRKWDPGVLFDWTRLGRR